jgi:hypothetical protein
MSELYPRLNQEIVTSEGNYFDCEIHSYIGFLTCPRCIFRGSAGDTVKITKCLYPCSQGLILVHGPFPWSHVGEINRVDYGRALGHHVDEGVIVCAVYCPGSSTMDRIIWALEVGSPTEEEYVKYREMYLQSRVKD